MRRLILLRHAKTRRESASGIDRDRALDERGRGDAATMGVWLARTNHRPDLVFVSTATRARETWDLMAPSLPATRKENVADLYGAGPQELLQIIHSAEPDDPGSLMIVGHNPGLHELALGLATKGEAAARQELSSHLPTTGVAIIDFPGDWTNVALGKGNLLLFMSPKLLKETSGSIRR